MIPLKLIKGKRGMYGHDLLFFHLLSSSFLLESIPGKVGTIPTILLIRSTS